MAKTPLSIKFSGRKLRGLRERRGWFQQDLSDRTAGNGHRVARALISAYELGTSSPSPRSFGALVQALDCDPDALLDADDLKESA